MGKFQGSPWYLKVFHFTKISFKQANFQIFLQSEPANWENFINPHHLEYSTTTKVLAPGNDRSYIIAYLAQTCDEFWYDYFIGDGK